MRSRKSAGCSGPCHRRRGRGQSQRRRRTRRRRFTNRFRARFQDLPGLTSRQRETAVPPYRKRGKRIIHSGKVPLQYRIRNDQDTMTKRVGHTKFGRLGTTVEVYQPTSSLRNARILARRNIRGLARGSSDVARGNGAAIATSAPLAVDCSSANVSTCLSG